MVSKGEKGDLITLRALYWGLKLVGVEIRDE
jgi:hypothetical protein